MRHVKIYEEFLSDDEMKDLLKGLSSVGLSSRFRVECNVFIMTPMKEMFWKEWPEWAFRNIDTEVYCEDDKEVVLEKAFEKVLNGEFEVEANVYLDKMFSSVPELVDVLSKENTIKIAKQVRNLPPSSTDRDDRGDLYTVQRILVEEIEGLMITRMKDTGYDEDYVLTHLNENIGYNVKIHNL